MPYGTYMYAFNPLTYAGEDDVIYLSNLLVNQGVLARFALTAHRRRGAWSSTLPVGTFDNNFRENACTWDQHAASRDRITTLAAADLPRRQRPIARNQDVLEVGGALFYHPEALRVYAAHVDHGAFLRALARFLEAADVKPALIVPPQPRRPYVERGERGPVRGPAWTPDEDGVIRRWFGPRSVGPHAGRHTSLTDAEWEKVLSDLPRRNKKGVHDRIVVLNRQLQHEFFRDGFVARDRLPQYMARVLGERPRIPIRPTKRRRRISYNSFGGEEGSGSQR